MATDDEDDPTRTCVKCRARPRWSRHGTCTRCLECAGRTVMRCILSRKAESYEPSSSPGCIRDRARYARKKVAVASLRAIVPKPTPGDEQHG